MGDQKDLQTCSTCEGLLSQRDQDRGTCHLCRSPKGKISQLDIAIRLNPPTPDEITGWPILRHLLHQRFGDTFELDQLWERCTDWLTVDGDLTPNTYLSLPLSYLRLLLKKGFPKDDRISACRLESLQSIKRTLENYTSSKFDNPHLITPEVIPVSDEISLAMANLLYYYAGDLPKPANGYWQTVLLNEDLELNQQKNFLSLLSEWIIDQIDLIKHEKKARNPTKVRKSKSHRGKNPKTRGDANRTNDQDILLIAALSKHHVYSQGACQNYEPISVSQLAAETNLSLGRVSKFFKTHFADHKTYKIACFAQDTLFFSLELLNCDMPPKRIFSRDPSKIDF